MVNKIFERKQLGYKLISDKFWVSIGDLTKMLTDLKSIGILTFYPSNTCTNERFGWHFVCQNKI